jgi:conjugal transfer mating pair stabilization protein TraN
MSFRKAVICFTLACFVTTQTASLAGPHDEGVAAGQAANPVARGSVTAPGAGAVVPAYTATPPERAHYRQPNLPAQGSARLNLCATMPNDPVCQALTGAHASANAPRPPVTADDPAVAAARAIGGSPSRVLGGLASYYSGCTTTVSNLPAGTETRTCLRHEGVGNYRCTRSLTVATERSSNCTPGDWFAHAGSGRTGVDVQCLPDQPATAQHMRITRDGRPLAFFDVNMSAPVLFPERVAVLASGSAVWVADKRCDGSQCSLTAMIAAESRDECSGSVDSGYTCTSVRPFLPTYAACRPGTQSGDNIQDAVCNWDSSCTTTTLDGTRCYAPASGSASFTGFDITQALPG